VAKASYTAVLSVIDRVTAPLKKLERQLRPFKRALGDISNAGQGLQSALGGIALSFGVIFGAAGIGGVGDLGTKLISTSAEFEKFQTVLETLEGSSAKAKSSMDWVAGFAAKTPYELNGVTDAFVKLKAYGIDPQAGALKSAGDAAAAMGKPLEQAVEALADAMTGENERLKEFGITAETAGDKIVYRWQENGKAMVATAKKNSREQIQATIEGIWNGRYGGAMDKLSGTWDGMWSNLQDTFTRVFKMIGDAGIFDELKGELKGVLDTLAAMEADGSLQAFAQVVSDELVSAFRELKSWVMAVDWKAVWGDVKAFAGGIGSVVEALGGLKGVAIAVAAVFSINVLASLASLASGFLSLAVAMGPVGWGIAAIAAGAALIYANWDGIVKYFTDKFDAVLAAFDEGFLQGMFRLWQEFNPVTLIMEAFDGLVKYLFGIDLGKIIGDQIKKVTELMPDWMIEGLGIEGGQGEAAPATVAPKGALAGANKQNLSGQMVVKFENTPPGTLVKPMPTSQPGVTMEADVGYRSLGLP
jgi:uncharacterized protein CbrC (UPF0167 family)